MEKWTIKRDSLYNLGLNSWCCDIKKEGDKLISIIVYAESKEQCLSRANRICKMNEMESLIEIIHGRRYQSNFTDTLIEKIELLYNDLIKRNE